MKTNTIKRAFAALAVSAVALSASAITASAETAKGYTSTGKAAADFKGAALDLTQKTISLDEAKNVQTIVLAAKGDGTQFDSTGIHIKFDAGLELVQTEYMEEKVWAAPQTAVKTYEAVQDGTDGLFLTFANSTPKAATTAGLKLWAFDVKVKNPEAGKKYPIEIAYEDGDLFDLKGSADTEAIRDYAFSNVTQGYIEIVAPTTTTTTATTTTTSTTSTTTTSTTSTTTTSGSKTTTSAKTTTKPVSTTKPKDNSPKTGVPGAGIAVAGLAVAIGTAFVLRKKED
jgi:hypothetical protein